MCVWMRVVSEFLLCNYQFLFDGIVVVSLLNTLPQCALTGWGGS